MTTCLITNRACHGSLQECGRCSNCLTWLRRRDAHKADRDVVTALEQENRRLRQESLGYRTRIPDRPTYSE